MRLFRSWRPLYISGESSHILPDPSDSVAVIEALRQAVYGRARHLRDGHTI
jgi:hypothetical protein